MGRRKLIFFVATDPATNPSPVAEAYEWASAAAAAHVATEVRLAGDAVLVADPAYVATLRQCRLLRERIDGAATDGVAVSACPTSVDSRGIHEDQLLAIGARRRPLGDILDEVADGKSVLVHV